MKQTFLFGFYRTLPFLAVAGFDALTFYGFGDTHGWPDWLGLVVFWGSFLFPGLVLLWGGHYLRALPPRSRFSAGAILLSVLVMAANPLLFVIKGCHDLSLHKGFCT
jgi:hypothetical protein